MSEERQQEASLSLSFPWPYFRVPFLKVFAVEPRPIRLTLNSTDVLRQKILKAIAGP